MRPTPEIIEGGSDFKSLLTEGKEEGEVARKWSLWKQIDPVSLLDEQKVFPGTPEYACSYFNHVFVFQTEENMMKFKEDPRKYLVSNP